MNMNVFPSIAYHRETPIGNRRGYGFTNPLFYYFYYALRNIAGS